MEPEKMTLSDPLISVAPECDDLKTWAYVEIMGHRTRAGYVTTRKFGIQVMLQIDVPRADGSISHSELYTPSSIFSIVPTTEEWVKRWAARHEMDSGPLPYIPSMRKIEDAETPSSDDDSGGN